MFPWHSLSCSLFFSLIFTLILLRDSVCGTQSIKAIPQMLLQCNIQQNSMLSLFNSIKMVHKVGRPWKSYQFVKISRQEIIVKSKLIKNWILSFLKIIRKWQKQFHRKVTKSSFKWKIIKIISEELIKKYHE